MKHLLGTIAAALVASVLMAAPSHATAARDLHESFTALPDGATPVVDSVTDFSYNAAATPVVRGGFLTTATPDEADGGSYRIADLGADVSKLGAEFAFSPYTRAGGVLCLSIQAESIATMTHGVPVSPVHLIVSPTFWSLDVNVERGTEVEPTFSGTFARPLTADGATLHRVDVVLDRAAGRVVLDLPDGRHILEHPAFKLAGEFAYVEAFKSSSTPLPPQANALVSSWWASSGAVVTEPAPVVAAQVVEAPVVAAPAGVAPVPSPVAPTLAKPSAPRHVKAVQHGKRVKVSWRAVAGAESYTVRCGRTSKTVTGLRAVLRAVSIPCKVRAANAAGSSAWVRVRA